MNLVSRAIPWQLNNENHDCHDYFVATAAPGGVVMTTSDAASEDKGWHRENSQVSAHFVIRALKWKCSHFDNETRIWKCIQNVFVTRWLQRNLWYWQLTVQPVTKYFVKMTTFPRISTTTKVNVEPYLSCIQYNSTLYLRKSHFVSSITPLWWITNHMYKCAHITQQPVHY